MVINHLQIFVIVAHTHNFSRAAEIIKGHQPNVTRAIRSLERDLGVRLFHRGRRVEEIRNVPVSLTEAGQALLPQAKSVLGAVNELRFLASQYRDETDSSPQIPA